MGDTGTVTALEKMRAEQKWRELPMKARKAAIFLHCNSQVHSNEAANMSLDEINQKFGSRVYLPLWRALGLRR